MWHEVVSLQACDRYEPTSCLFFRREAPRKEDGPLSANISLHSCTADAGAIDPSHSKSSLLGLAPLGRLACLVGNF